MPAGGTAQRNLTDVQKQALANSAQVAITVEQLGGSPTGQPTSTPIYVVPLRSPLRCIEQSPKARQPRYRLARVEALPACAIRTKRMRRRCHPGLVLVAKLVA